jgi:aspartyl aminopeptidase
VGTQDESKNKNAWSKMDDADIRCAMEFAKGYISFLNTAKTERETADYIAAQAKQAGFKDFEAMGTIKPGDKFFMTKNNKVTALIIAGKEPPQKGFNLVVSHIDSPRLDLKAHPLYEADGMALLKTHYYGGIKKYQWVAIPLALHGVVVKKTGEIITVKLGEKEDELGFTITDLLPHLGKDQMDKKMSEAIKGEDLNILVGSRPLTDDEKEPIKRSVLNLLKEEYGIDEDDFVSAEIEAVPAFPAREIGFDRSMVGAYGQDDRVSAYASCRAILDCKAAERTSICLCADKEEIGSAGNTGLQSLIIENIVSQLLHKQNIPDYYTLRKCLESSYALSADVNAAVDPTYPQVFEKMNNSFLGHGVVLTKFTGSRGKYDSNDSNPEFVAKIRSLFDQNRIAWQVGELGKVDIGGGGTVAQYLARYGMEVIDCGVALLSMHSPFEISSKADLYMSYKAYKCFFELNS